MHLSTLIVLLLISIALPLMWLTWQQGTRAAEAAAYIRKAISHAMPREQIVQEIAGGYGKPGTVPIPYSAPEYDRDILKPIAYDLDMSRQYLERAGYRY